MCVRRQIYVFVKFAFLKLYETKLIKRMFLFLRYLASKLGNTSWNKIVWDFYDVPEVFELRSPMSFYILEILKNFFFELFLLI